MIYNTPRVGTLARAAIASLLTATLLLGGCSGGMSDLENYVRDVKQRPAPPLDPLPVMKQFENFEYTAQNLRDPFSNPRESEAGGTASGPRPDPNRRKEPLEAFPLDGLDMVGTLGSGNALVALVMDPERVIHRVSAGNYMGQNEGRISDVYEDIIKLVELVPDGTGKFMKRSAEVALDDK